MTKSNLKVMCYVHGRENVANHIGISLTTMNHWIKRGYATPIHIKSLSEYPESIITEDELIQDIKDNKE